jgi:Cytochrome c7 and related cytochrome c
VRTAFSTSALLAAVLLLTSAQHSADPKAYAPRQPIDFSHLVHVSGDKLSCDLCHSAARRSPFAGIAPVERCMGCHRVVNPESPEILKVRQFWEANQPVPWVKVYVLPRFVHFDHEAHVLARVACETCHGDVARMDRITLVRDLTMGWCVGCHRTQHASDDCLTCHY